MTSRNELQCARALADAGRANEQNANARDVDQRAADVRRVEQSAIGTIVDVELSPSAFFDAHNHRIVLSAKRATRLAPKFG